MYERSKKLVYIYIYATDYIFINVYLFSQITKYVTWSLEDFMLNLLLNSIF